MSDSFAHRDPHPHGDPVDRRQETYRPSPYASQVTPPHGRVTPDGKRAYPHPSLTARVLVWGGMAVAAAAVTAGSVLAVNKVVDLVAGDDEPDHDHRETHRAHSHDAMHDAPRPRRSLAPRFADMTEAERAQMRRRQRAREADMERHADAIRAQAKDHRPMRRRRKPQMGLLEEIETNARHISASAEGIMASLGAAIAGFRTVAGQAEGVIREFSHTADQVRGFLGTADRSTSARKTPETRRESFKRPLKREMVDLRDDADAARARGQDADKMQPTSQARTHRL